jgi:hypothetical protein
VEVTQVRTHQRLRCPQCGAKNDDVELCRICGLALPAADDPHAPTFEDAVNDELASWAVIAEDPVMRGEPTSRPAALEVTRVRWPSPTVVCGIVLLFVIGLFVALSIAA